MIDMMKFASFKNDEEPVAVHIIENDSITNTILVNSLDMARLLYPSVQCVLSTGQETIGDLWDGSKFTKLTIIERG